MGIFQLGYPNCAFRIRTHPDLLSNMKNVGWSTSPQITHELLDILFNVDKQLLTASHCSLRGVMFFLKGGLHVCPVFRSMRTLVGTFCHPPWSTGVDRMGSNTVSCRVMSMGDWSWLSLQYLNFSPHCEGSEVTSPFSVFRLCEISFNDFFHQRVPRHFCWCFARELFENPQGSPFNAPGARAPVRSFGFFESVS